jgi:hypothetical protein
MDRGSFRALAVAAGDGAGPHMVKMAHVVVRSRLRGRSPRALTALSLRTGGLGHCEFEYWSSLSKCADVSEWIYFLHPPRDDFAATITEEEAETWSHHFLRSNNSSQRASWSLPVRRSVA